MIRKNDAVKIIVFSFISGKIEKFLEKSRIFSILLRAKGIMGESDALSKQIWRTHLRIMKSSKHLIITNRISWNLK